MIAPTVVARREGVSVFKVVEVGSHQYYIESKAELVSTEDHSTIMKTRHSPIFIQKQDKRMAFATPLDAIDELGGHELRGPQMHSI